MVRTVNKTELRKSITSWLEWMVSAQPRHRGAESRPAGCGHPHYRKNPRDAARFVTQMDIATR